MPATVYQRLNLLKSEYSRNDLRRIANWINAVWRKNHEEEPPKVEQQENDKVFQVFCYPDDMFEIMDEIIGKYFVNKEKTAVRHNELQEQLKLQKENKPPKAETKGAAKEKGGARPGGKPGADKRRPDGHGSKPQGGFKPKGEWKPREGGESKPKGEWKPREGGEFKPKGEWKPREGGFKPKGEWKPREGGFKPKGEWKPREGDAPNKYQSAWKPSDGEPKARGEWKPRQEGGYKPRGEWKPREGDAYNKPKREFDPYSYDYDKKNEHSEDDASKPKRRRIGTVVFSADAESGNKE